MADGKKSRPTIMKMDEDVAIVLNLIVVLDKGAIESLQWRNNCFDMQACGSGNDICKDTSVTVGDDTYEEENCLRKECASESNENTCDTQVFVTWWGRDSDRDDCTSDNFRISGFVNYSIISYLDAAKKLVNL